MNFKELHKTGESQHLEFKTSFGKGVVEIKTLPDKPNSKYQKYRLTEKGKQMKQTLKT